MDVLWCERVNDFRHSLFHLLNCLITTASELRQWPKVTGCKVWAIGRLRNCLDANLGQIIYDKDGVVDWCIVLVEMPLTRFEESGPLPKESLPELPLNLNIVTLTLTLWPIIFGVLTSLLLPHPSSSLTYSLPSLNLLCHSKTDSRFIQDGWKAVWSILYVSVSFCQSLKQNFTAHLSSKGSSGPVCIFEIHQLRQSGFSRMYSNSCSRCSFEPESIIIGQSSPVMYNNKIMNFQESTTMLNACTKKVWKLIVYTTYIRNLIYL